MTSALLGKHDLQGYIVSGKRARFPSTFWLVLQNAPGVRETKTRSLVAWQCSANCTAGPALMIIFCISQIRPHSRWDAAAVTRSGNWAAVQKRSGLRVPDRLRGGIAAGTLRAGEGELASQPLWPGSWICWMEFGAVWT